MVYCERCDRYFSFRSAYLQHIRDSAGHNVCDDCDLDFSSWQGLKEHWVQSPHHFYCQYCNSHFDDNSDLVDHYIDDHYYCEPCGKVFKTEHGLHEHNRQCHHYCVSCRRVFLSAQNLTAHLNSSIHKPKDVLCPLRGCGQSFVSKSALILHLESGSCRSGANRRLVNDYVRRMDHTNIITDPSRLLTAGEDDKVDYIATEASWNGRAYECVLCHSCFRKLVDLNRHLASPRHQSKIYKCPLSSCQTRFNTLSGLCQHIESEKCGVAKFKVVKQTLDDVFSSMGRITYH
ncbi:hypothetical protein ID866_6896 [Astraeus odoratus]|nr:hypothetical protein ID866_6896 [Astraeus odoratus]